MCLCIVLTRSYWKLCFKVSISICFQGTKYEINREDVVGPLRLFMACVRRGRPLAGRVAEISGNKVDEQVTEYSNLWFS